MDYSGFVAIYKQMNQQELDYFSKIKKEGVIGLIIAFVFIGLLSLLVGKIVGINGSIYIILILGFIFYWVFAGDIAFRYFLKRSEKGQLEKAFQYRTLSTNSQALATELRGIKQNTHEIKTELRWKRRLDPSTTALLEENPWKVISMWMTSFTIGGLILPFVIKKIKKLKEKYKENLKNVPSIERYMEIAYSSDKITL